MQIQSPIRTRLRRVNADAGAIPQLQHKTPIQIAVGGAIYAAGLAHAVTALIHSVG